MRHASAQTTACTCIPCRGAHAAAPAEYAEEKRTPVVPVAAVDTAHPPLIRRAEVAVLHLRGSQAQLGLGHHLAGAA